MNEIFASYVSNTLPSLIFFSSKGHLCVNQQDAESCCVVPQAKLLRACQQGLVLYRSEPHRLDHRPFPPRSFPPGLFYSGLSPPPVFFPLCRFPTRYFPTVFSTSVLSPLGFSPLGLFQALLFQHRFFTLGYFHQA